MAKLSRSVVGDAASGELFRTRIDALTDEIEAFRKGWNVAELALFGSVLRDDFNPHSDIDVQVEFERGGHAGGPVCQHGNRVVAPDWKAGGCLDALLR